MGNNDLKGDAKTAPSNPYTPTPWNLYDRISSIKLSNVNGEEGKDEIYQGIVIGQRQIMGIKDSFVIPIVASLIVVGLGFSFIKNFLIEDKTSGIVTLNPWFWLVEALFIALGVTLGVFSLRRGIKARNYNREKGMSAIYLNPEKRTLAIRDIQGPNLVLPFRSILSCFRISTFELTISGIGIKIFPRLFLHYQDEQGKKHWKIVHFLDDPESVIHWFDLVNFEYRGEKTPEK